MSHSVTTILGCLVIFTKQTIGISVQNYNESVLRILNGYPCDLSEYRYLAVIKNGDSVFCGASVLSMYYGLTAAHCCKGMEPLKDYPLYAGVKNVNEEFEQKVGILMYIIHENYATEPKLDSDICVIEFDAPIVETDLIKYSQLVTAATYEEIISEGLCKKATVMGFGDQNFKKPGQLENTGDFNPVAQCVEMEVLGEERCLEVTDLVGETIFCGYDSTMSGKDSCHGDSGGPLFCDDIQIGVVSAGYGCGVPDMPAFYSRVDCFKSFIEESMRGMQLHSDHESVFMHDSRLIILTVVIVFINK